MQLSEAQKRAVETTEGQVILISCPGSGKTSTVVNRVAHMVQKGIPESSILVLTFSKAAAVEMKERYTKLMKSLGNSTASEGAHFSTIHSFCYNVVAPAYRLTYENILKESEAWMIVRTSLDELKKEKKLKMEIRDYVDFTSSCLNEISMVNNNGVEWDTYKAKTCATQDFYEIYQAYVRKKQAMGKIDFDDMLSMCYTLLSNDAQLLEWYRQKFRYIIVDEYQDTNFMQRDILYLLAGQGPDANICVVGDDDQSIYKFRGARPEIMLNFSKAYPGCSQIYMDVNYRSEPAIVEAAKRLIGHNTERFKKDIKPFKAGTGSVETKSWGTAAAECNGIVKKIKELGANRPYEDMAVLFRNNRQANYISMLLLGEKIPFHSNDMLVSQYRHWIFSDILAFYKLANGTGSSQALIQVINKPNRFVPVRALRNVPVDEDAVCKAVRLEIMDEWKRRKTAEQVHDFFRNLDFIQGTELVQMLKIISSIAGYHAYLSEYESYRNMAHGELTSVFESYIEDAKAHGFTSMEELEEYAKSVNERIDRINADRTKDGVTLSTMHKSKGLEWPAVFILGANDGTIPSKRAISEGPESIEEERRLFYVAATRAKEQLYVSWTEPKAGGSGKSRFVGEMMGEASCGAGRQKGHRLRKHGRVIHPAYGKGTVIATAPDAAVVKFDSKPDLKKFEGDSLTELQITK